MSQAEEINEHFAEAVVILPVADGWVEADIATHLAIPVRAAGQLAAGQELEG